MIIKLLLKVCKQSIFGNIWTYNSLLVIQIVALLEYFIFNLIILILLPLLLFLRLLEIVILSFAVVAPFLVKVMILFRIFIVFVSFIENCCHFLGEKLLILYIFNEFLSCLHLVNQLMNN